MSLYVKALGPLSLMSRWRNTSRGAEGAGVSLVGCVISLQYVLIGANSVGGLKKVELCHQLKVSQLSRMYKCPPRWLWLVSGRTREDKQHIQHSYARVHGKRSITGLPGGRDTRADSSRWEEFALWWLHWIVTVQDWNEGIVWTRKL